MCRVRSVIVPQELPSSLHKLVCLRQSDCVATAGLSGPELLKAFKDAYAAYGRIDTVLLLSDGGEKGLLYGFSPKDIVRAEEVEM